MASPRRLILGLCNFGSALLVLSGVAVLKTGSKVVKSVYALHTGYMVSALTLFFLGNVRDLMTTIEKQSSIMSTATVAARTFNGLLHLIVLMILNFMWKTADRVFVTVNIIGSQMGNSLRTAKCRVTALQLAFSLIFWTTKLLNEIGFISIDKLRKRTYSVMLSVGIRLSLEVKDYVVFYILILSSMIEYMLSVFVEHNYLDGNSEVDSVDEEKSCSLAGGQGTNLEYRALFLVTLHGKTLRLLRNRYMHFTLCVMSVGHATLVIFIVHSLDEPSANYYCMKCFMIVAYLRTVVIVLVPVVLCTLLEWKRSQLLARITRKIYATDDPFMKRLLGRFVDSASDPYPDTPSVLFDFDVCLLNVMADCFLLVATTWFSY